MNYSIKEVAERLKGLRETLEISIDEICKRTSTSKEDYEKIENGEKDFSVSFIYKCAEVFGVDIPELYKNDKSVEIKDSFKDNNIDNNNAVVGSIKVNRNPIFFLYFKISII